MSCVVFFFGECTLAGVDRQSDELSGILSVILVLAEVGVGKWLANTFHVPQKPKIESKGRKFERARGRRRSRGFKV